MEEPLLLEEEETAGQAPASTNEAPAPVKSAEEEALDQEELQLFWCSPYHALVYLYNTSLSAVRALQGTVGAPVLHARELYRPCVH